MDARPTLRRGDVGEWVRLLQEALIAEGVDPGAVDGDFGVLTERAVMELQASRGLEVDGVVGTMTWNVLGVPEPVRVDWTAVDGDERMRSVMALLADEYGYPVNGAAGIVGNLWAESSVLPPRIEGSSSAMPMRARDFAGNIVDFTVEQIMNRNQESRIGPARPGVGLAQWTFASRRAGLFRHAFHGNVLGGEILFSMQAQVDYLVHEMQTDFARVHRVLSDPLVSVDDASDEVVYNFEVPGSILAGGAKLPRTDPRVQATFEQRRQHSRRASDVYRLSRL
jgi:Putative peptidoglycan binding domain/Phage tail lysozyme